MTGCVWVGLAGVRFGVAVAHSLGQVPGQCRASPVLQRGGVHTMTGSVGVGLAAQAVSRSEKAKVGAMLIHAKGLRRRG